MLGGRAAGLCGIGGIGVVLQRMPPVVVLAAALLGGHSTLAQDAGVPRDPGQKTVRIVRTDTPPVIDGVLDDAVWAQAAVIDDLHQVNPVEYAAASERTEIRLLYDDENLYVAARLYQKREDTTANVLRQNSPIVNDDAIFVTIDPFNSRRAGYFFGVNPHGVRYDGLYRNVSEFYSDWDSIWYVETGEFDGGWTAEYRIPFKSLSFDPNSDTWGLNFSRSLQKRDEDIAWVSRNRRWDPSSSGLMTGLEGINQGVGLDIVPSATLINRRTFAPNHTSNSDFEPSLDIAYKLTPGLNALLTFNTDFSATEVDDRQVNLTRFNLFFPEKRDFFLREADIFEFGRIGASDGNGAVSNAERQNGRPFFSRRIGLDLAGQPLDLKYGGKISGRAGRFEIGALSIRQGESLGVDDSTLSVVRAKAGIGTESTIGMIATSGDPLSNIDNSLGGVDFLYRNSRLPGGRTIEAGAWFQKSSTDGLEGNDTASGFGISLPNQVKFRGGLAMKQFEENFFPALGFVSRTGVRDVSGHLAYTHRPMSGYWQSLYFGIEASRIEELHTGRLQSESWAITPFQLTNRTGDTIFWRSNFDKEVLPFDFELLPGIVIPAGEYSFHDHGVEVGFANFRKVAGRIAYIDGEFYTGTSDRVFGNFTWQPSPRFRTYVTYNINKIELPQGKFTTRIISTSFDVIFNSRLSWVNLIQYDNVSEMLGINIRLHYIPEAGRQIFFVINHGLQDLDRDNRFHSQLSDVVAKVGYTFRF